ncbi:uncharacterized protein LOC135112912 [Scylla paramamosain]|uniref:uncharacterized protein LOC135112912 n=1 Tax=Scylla paramamosain TaxID=85552 RepID=UPI0030832DB4
MDAGNWGGTGSLLSQAFGSATPVEGCAIRCHLSRLQLLCPSVDSARFYLTLNQHKPQQTDAILVVYPLILERPRERDELKEDLNLLLNYKGSEECDKKGAALLKNQDRAGKVNGPSIFPDLCTSHRKNLMHMLKNHQKLQDIKRRCIKAKEELSENLHVRLKWIMYIERRLYEADTRVSIHQESVRRLAGLLQVVEQIHPRPEGLCRSRSRRWLAGTPSPGPSCR